MKYKQLTLQIKPYTPENIDILTAYLAEAGCDSFQQEGETLQAYIPLAQYDEGLIRETIRNFPVPHTEISCTPSDPEDKDWNEEWEKNYFQPIRIGKECIIRASFHAPEQDYTYNIIIDPKMAFGTGNHETTHLMIDEMLQSDLAGKEVLDMGCGTAVLAILARLKGAKRVVAIDIDEWAYNNALENIRLNHVEDIQVALGGAEKISLFGTFDIILANINRNILLRDIPLYAASLNPGGNLYMSGFYEEDIPIIESECQKHGLYLAGYKERNHWVAVKSAWR